MTTTNTTIIPPPTSKKKSAEFLGSLVSFIDTWLRKVSTFDDATTP